MDERSRCIGTSREKNEEGEEKQASKKLNQLRSSLHSALSLPRLPIVTYLRDAEGNRSRSPRGRPRGRRGGGGGGRGRGRACGRCLKSGSFLCRRRRLRWRLLLLLLRLHLRLLLLCRRRGRHPGDSLLALLLLLLLLEGDDTDAEQVLEVGRGIGRRGRGGLQRRRESISGCGCSRHRRCWSGLGGRRLLLLRPPRRGLANRLPLAGLGWHGAERDEREKRDFFLANLLRVFSPLARSLASFDRKVRGAKSEFFLSFSLTYNLKKNKTAAAAAKRSAVSGRALYSLSASYYRHAFSNTNYSATAPARGVRGPRLPRLDLRRERSRTCRGGGGSAGIIPAAGHQCRPLAPELRPRQRRRGLEGTLQRGREWSCFDFLGERGASGE